MSTALGMSRTAPDVLAVPISPDDARSNTVFKLCVDTLKAGCPQAFEQIFWLGHRPPFIVDPLSEEKFVLPLDALEWCQVKLTSVEESVRAHDYEETYNLLLEVADKFDSFRDRSASTYFHAHALDHCRASAQPALLARAHLNCGIANSARQKLHVATDHLRTALRLCDAAGPGVIPDSLRQRTATHYLTALHDYATHESARGHVAHAKALIEEALAAARAAGDDAAVARGYHELGTALAAEGRTADARAALQQVRVAAARVLAKKDRTAGDPEVEAVLLVESRARNAVAALYTASGDVDAATASLEQARALALDGGNHEGACDAAGQLALLALRAGELTRAMEHASQQEDSAARVGTLVRDDALRRASYVVRIYYLTQRLMCGVVCFSFCSQQGGLARGCVALDMGLESVITRDPEAFAEWLRNPSEYLNKFIKASS